MSWSLSGLMKGVKGMFGYEDLEVEDGGVAGGQDHAVKPEERAGLWKQLSSYMGKDITSMISLPVWIFEPLSFLQIMAEPLQFDELLKEASENPEAALRLAYLMAFITAGYSTAVRNKKAFNPLLGETFDYVPKDKKWKLYAEQVSHHPPIGVTQVHNDKFNLHLEMDIKTKFKGNSIDVIVNGVNSFDATSFGDHFEWGHLETCAHNTIIGGMWIDHFGTVTITNTNTGMKGLLTFTKCGWLGAGRFEVTGDITDKSGAVLYKVNGKWNENFNVTKPTDGAEPKNLWTRGNIVVDKWNHPAFVTGLNEFEKESDLLPTDSRLRTDRLNLEKGDLDLAGKEKVRLEEVQRAARKEREGAGDEWDPKFFKRATSEEGPRWIPKNNYWEHKAEHTQA